MRLRFCALALPALLAYRQDDDTWIEKLKSPSFAEQGQAADALVERGGKAVQRLVDSDDPDLRDWGRRIQARLDRKFRALIEKLGSADDEESEAAQTEILKQGPAAIPHLREALKSEHKNLRGRAQKLLDKLESQEDTIGVGRGEGGKYGSRLGGRRNCVARGGGGRDTEDAVASALGWLLRHQGKDGSWKSSECCKPDPGNSELEAGLTGLSLLAFLGAGYTHLNKEDWGGTGVGAAVQKGAQWILRNQDKEGCIGPRGERYMYSHLLCALALIELHGITGSNLFKEPAQKALDFTIAAQNPRKGWRYSTRSGDNDSSVTGWAMAVFRAAELSGLTFPKSAREGGLAWFDEVTEKNYFRVGYTHLGTGKVYAPGQNENFNHHETLTAMAMMSRDRKSAAAIGGAQLLIRDLPKWLDNDIDFYYWHHGTNALYAFDGPDGRSWKQWNEAMKAALVLNQNTKKDGCKAGSWEPVDRWSHEGGRIYATALNAMTLETYYRSPAK